MKVQFLMILLAGNAISCLSSDAGKKLSASFVSDTIDVEPSSKRHQEKKLSNDTLTIAMVGDIMMGTTWPTVQLPVNDGRDMFRDCGELLRKADLAVGNLEGALCEGLKSRKTPGKYSYSFSMPLRYGKYLSACGFDFLSIANNHSNDFSAAGLASTERTLDSLGILHCGVKGHKEYAILEHRGLKIGFCAFGHNAYTLLHTDMSTVKRIINEVRPKVDLLIVSFHGGAEGRDRTHLPNGQEIFLGENRGNLRAFTHAAIDMGADVVYGHGPHVPRCVEVYKNHFIAYSLGNFCTTRSVNLTGVCGYAPLIEIRIDGEGRFLDGQIHSYKQSPGVGPRKDAAYTVAKEIRQLSLSDVPSSQASISETGKIELKR